MSHRFMYSNLIGENAVIDARTTAAGFVGGAVPRVANGPGSMVFSGTYTGDDPEIYTVEIDAAGDVGTATFKWRKSTSAAGAWETSGVATALTDTTLEAGVNVRFLNGSNSPAFDMGDRWQAAATRFRSPKRVIDLDPATKWRGEAPASDPEYLTFDLGAAQTPDAVIVHGHNISSGAAVKIQGANNSALEFDMESGAVVVPDHASIQNIWDGGGSIEAWVYPRSAGEGSFGFIASKFTSGWRFLVHGLSGGKLKIGFQENFSSANGVWETSTAALVLDQWSHVVITYNSDSVANDPFIYIDGVAQTITESTTPVGTRSSDVGTVFVIGNNSFDSGTWDGFLDEVRIYTRTLSAAEAAARALGTYTDESGLAGYWPLDEGTGLATADASANSNDGTLSGDAAWAAGNGPYWATSLLDETITHQAGTMFKYLTTSPRSFRYWRLLITGDSANTDGWLEVAEVFLGAYFEPAYNYDFGNVLGEQSFEETRETESKAEKTVLLNRGRTAALPYRHVTAAEKDLFLTMFRAVKDTAAERNKPLFVHLDVDDGESLIFAAIGGPFSPNEEGPDDFSFELELRERLA